MRMMLVHVFWISQWSFARATSRTRPNPNYRPRIPSCHPYSCRNGRCRVGLICRRSHHLARPASHRPRRNDCVGQQFCLTNRFAAGIFDGVSHRSWHVSDINRHRNQTCERVRPRKTPSCALPGYLIDELDGTLRLHVDPSVLARIAPRKESVVPT